VKLGAAGGRPPAGTHRGARERPRAPRAATFAHLRPARYIRGVRPHPSLQSLAAALAVVAVLGGCGRHAEPKPTATDAPEIVVRTVAVEHPQYRPDEYVQAVATRVHVARPQQSAFWRSVGSYFVSRSTSAILTVGMQVNGQTVGVLPLATVKSGARTVTREVKENQSLTPPLRLQRGDQLTLQVSLVEASEENETKIVNAAKTVGSVASLPVSTMAPGGGAALDVAGQFWQLARAAGKPQDVTLKREGGLDRPLWEVARIELVPAADLGRFEQDRDRLLDPTKVLADDDPTFVEIRVERRDHLYDPNLVLVEPSPMRGKIAFFLDEMREGNDLEKIKSCRRLRRFLRTTVGVNPADETTVVLAALRETGYDPDRSQAHLEGCLTDQDVRAARAAGFHWGSCESSAPCRLARTFADTWFARGSLVPITAAPIAVYDRVGGPGAREDVDPGAFLELLELQPSWEPPTGESDTTASFRGVVSRAGQARQARVRVSVSFDAAAAPRITRVDLCDPAAAECAAP
jgi:hypothetical protein